MPCTRGQTKDAGGWIVELSPAGAVVGGGAVCRAARVEVWRGTVAAGAGACLGRGAVLVVRGAAERAGGVVGPGGVVGSRGSLGSFRFEWLGTVTLRSGPCPRRALVRAAWRGRCRPPVGSAGRPSGRAGSRARAARRSGRRRGAACPRTRASLASPEGDRQPREVELAVAPPRARTGGSTARTTECQEQSYARAPPCVRRAVRARPGGDRPPASSWSSDRGAPRGRRAAPAGRSDPRA